METVIRHRDCYLALEHHPVAQFQRSDRRKGGGDPHRHENVLAFGRLSGIMQFVADDGPEVGHSQGVRTSRSRFGEVAKNVCGRGLSRRHQPRGHQKGGVGGGRVETVDSQPVPAGPKQPSLAVQIVGFIGEGLGVAALGRGSRVPGSVQRIIRRRNLQPVQVGNEPVIIFHEQAQVIESAGIGHFEGPAEIGGSVVRVHSRLDVGGDDGLES